MDSFDKGWFVLQTYSGYENKVKENLLQRAQTYNMLDNILRVEIPTQTVQVGEKWKEKEVEENRFPGYVLVEMVMTDEAWFVVRNTPNVTGFVGSHGNRSKPTPLLEQETVIFWFQWDKLFKSLILTLKLARQSASLMVLLQTTQVKLLKLITTK